MPTNEYCIYLRKSRADFEAESHGEGETLSRHRTALIALANKQNLSVTKIYEEVVSGDTVAARPVMQQLLEDVSAGLWKGVLVMEVERLARGDTMDQGLVAQTFKYSNTLIVTPLKTYNPNDEFDEEYFEFGLFMSRREYKTINRRLQRGREASAREGKFIASIAPYGYKRKKLDNDKGYTLELVPEQADVVRMIFDFYTNGTEINGQIRRLGIQALASHLNNLGIKSYRNDYWQKETIRDMIRNPTYAGYIRWGYRKVQKKVVNGKPTTMRPINYNEECILAEGLHEAIVSKELFDKANAMLDSENINPPVRLNKQIKNQLCGIVHCAKCGRKMTMRAGRENHPTYLVCHARSCDMVSTPLHLVEERLLSILRQWLDYYKIRSAESSVSAVDTKPIENAIKQTEADIERLKKQRLKAHALVEQEVYTVEMFLERSKDINDEIDAATAKLENLHSELSRLSERETMRSEFIPKIEHLLEVYDSLPNAEAKNKMLKEVLQKIVYNKEKAGVANTGSVESFELTAYPLLPETLD